MSIHLNGFDFRLMIGYQVIFFSFSVAYSSFIPNGILHLFRMDHWKLQKDVGVLKAYFYTAKTYFF